MLPAARKKVKKIIKKLKQKLDSVQTWLPDVGRGFAPLGDKLQSAPFGHTGVDVRFVHASLPLLGIYSLIQRLLQRLLYSLF